MTLPVNDTLVTYPAGELARTATVLHAEVASTHPADSSRPTPAESAPAESAPEESAQTQPGLLAVLLDTTCVHPLDVGWPDQGPDRGRIRFDDAEYSIRDCVVGATDGQSLYLGGDVPARKGTEGWAFVVVHLLDADAPITEASTVTVSVDQPHRAALSAGHTGCHLAALALNGALARRWKKDVRADDLGHPDFDGLANTTSTIEEYGSTDTYRLGKSLRKKGFITDALADDLPGIETAINTALAEWIGAGSTVRIDRDGERLTDLRRWVCELPEATAAMPCGGTHARALSDLGSLCASLSLDDVDGTPVLTMTTGRR